VDKKSKSPFARRTWMPQHLLPDAPARWRQCGKPERGPSAGIAHTRRSASTSTARTWPTRPRASSWA